MLVFAGAAYTFDEVVATFAKECEGLQKVFGTLQVFNWECGLNLLNNKEGAVYIYYFLGEPIAVQHPIVKTVPPSSPLNLNSKLSKNLTKSMVDFCKAANVPVSGQ